LGVERGRRVGRWVGRGREMLVADPTSLRILERIAAVVMRRSWWVLDLEEKQAKLKVPREEGRLSSA